MPETVIPSRYCLRLKQRLAAIAYTEEHGIKPAGRPFGLDRRTVREWRSPSRTRARRVLLARYPKRRRRRLAPEMSPLIKQARTEHRFGAARTRIRRNVEDRVAPHRWTTSAS
jgi:hypothetical protein